MNVTGLALLGALAYGAGDFFGGLASRRVAASVVVALSQLAGLAVLGAVLIVAPERFYAQDLLLGVFVGVASALGIGALYAALGSGRMGVVSPISAVIGASVPVAAGLAFGERPGIAALVGVALAFVAVALVSAGGELRGFSFREPGVAAAVVSGLGIGCVMVLLARGHAGASLMLIGYGRLVSIPLLMAVARFRHDSLRTRDRTTFAFIIGAGLLDMTANMFYVVAAGGGMLSLVAVVTSLYPASTVLLARFVLGEKLSRSQWLGALCALAGVALIAL